MKIWIGIDPGKSGAIAAVGQDYYIVESYFRDELGCADIVHNLINEHKIVCAAIESVHAMPKQGVVSMFNFGANFGAWKGILAALGIPFRLVTPQEWQKGYFAKGEGKEGSLAAARRLFPQVDLSRKKDHGKADALLIADWCRRQGA